MLWNHCNQALMIMYTDSSIFCALLNLHHISSAYNGTSNRVIGPLVFKNALEKVTRISCEEFYMEGRGVRSIYHG